MRTPETPLKLDFTGRAKTNEVAVARLIGFEAKEIADGRATVVLEAGPQHANPMGTLHGGILCDIADAAMGMAFASTLAPGGLSCEPMAKWCGAVAVWAMSSAISQTNAASSLPRQRRLVSCCEGRKRKDVSSPSKTGPILLPNPLCEANP